jgi:hypothetical protein
MSTPWTLLGESWGTEGLSETVNAALRDAARRRVLKGFDVVRDVDGAPQEVAAGRERS